MSNNNQKSILFNSKLIISDHFAEVINRLNDHVNDLVFKFDSLKLNLINKTKDKFINQLKLVEKYNLDHMTVASAQKLECTEKNRIIDLLKRDLIKLDCFLLRNTCSNIGYSLVITDWYVDSENIAFLR
jgi:hypothetical protein